MAGVARARGKLEYTSPAQDRMFRRGHSGTAGRWQQQPIEEVATDDEVLAYDPETGETERRRVVRTFVHQDKATLRVTIQDGSSVITTEEHPFMVLGTTISFR